MDRQASCSLPRVRENPGHSRLKSAGSTTDLFTSIKGRTVPPLLRPVVFVGAFTLLGVLFALQEWVSLHSWNSHITITFRLLMAAWGVHYFLVGTICWLLWRLLGHHIQKATPFHMATRILPLSLAVSVFEEMIWVAIFPGLPIGLPRMTYWHRLAFHLDSDLVDSLVIFWAVFFL